jgi:NADH-quinone oxidoreductase subunit G
MNKYFYINNKKFNYTLEFQSNIKNYSWKHTAPLIEYCETLGINIPHYCYHKGLSISGNCRMCLVELKNSPKPMVSCAMSAKSCLNNNKIYTESPLVKKARENILEFLLLNHPLDCPICDQGGECDLQDQSLYFGTEKKRFYNFKRVVTDKNIGPIIKTVMTRCIHCTRCVRFSTEIAGTEDLGMFGRGLDSEIGTYVPKTFQSELSGNVIDLCPVGALTQKPYPFLSRSWELKTTNSIDFSDGFGSETQVFFKNNQIVKITSKLDNNSNTTNWISDKARFLFDGMFSPARVLKGLINFRSNKFVTSPTWNVLFKEIITTIYFQDHLNKHFLKTKKLILIFSNSINFETLNLIYLLSQTYSFIELRKCEGNKLSSDFEYLTHSHKRLNKELNTSNLCFLLGLYSRYEGVNLNLNLRSRYLKRNFKVISLGSTKNYTFPAKSIGSNINSLKSLTEGNSLFCQDFINLKNPTIIVSSNSLKRKDANSLWVLLNMLTKSLSKYHFQWNNLNVLNTSLNETGINYLNSFKVLSETDIKITGGLYFLNTQPNMLNFKKIIKLKLLNFYFNSNNKWTNFCVEQTIGFKNSDLELFCSAYKPYNSIKLPNSTFFESNGTFLNTEGLMKKSIKFISTESQTKEDWQIIRKLFLNLTKVSGLTYKTNLFVNVNNIKQYNNFKNYLFFAKSSFTNLIDNTKFSNKSAETYKILKFKNSKTKLFTTKIKMWLNDFYTGGSDPYSRHSITMIKCSKDFRSEKHNFSHLI